jgi:hypothetical protein
MTTIQLKTTLSLMTKNQVRIKIITKEIKVKSAGICQWCETCQSANGKAVTQVALTTFQRYMQRWFSNLHFMSCDNKDWKTVKQELLRRFGIGHHCTNEDEYF